MFVFFIMVSGLPAAGQHKTDLSLGAGFTETLNVGMRYQVLERSQIGLSIGTWPSPNDWLFNWNSLISLSGDFYYHFGGSSQYSDIAPWYIRTGIDYIRIAGESYVENNLESHLRIGRDFFLFEDIGFRLDVGIATFLLNETGFATVLPALGFVFFVGF